MVGGKSKTYNTVNTDGSTKEHSEQEFNIYNCMWNCDYFTKFLYSK